MSVTAAWFGDNSFQVDAENAEKSVRSKYPKLLHPKEKIELAFVGRGGTGRDKSYFTSHRILIKDGKGIGSKRKNYLSIPYWSIQAFFVETAGKFDGDTSLKVFSDGKERRTKIEFARDQVNLWSVSQYMNQKVLRIAHTSGGDDDSHSVTPIKVDAKKTSSLDRFVDWIGDNAKQLDPKDVEQHLKTEFPLLTADEIVELAFKAGRDTTVFTNKRILLVDVQGVFGKKVEFASFLWSSIRAFSVETAGQYFDRDTDMKIYTNIMDYGRIRQDFRKHKADLFGIQKFLCNKVLGEDKNPVEGVQRYEGHVDPDTSWWGRDNNRPLDANEMDRRFHSNPPLLQGSETVEMAFKGRRDMVLFTTKRLLLIDPKGLTGKKIEYTSIPWNAAVAFGVETAGKYMDNDGEAKIWTDMMFESKGDEPDPGMSFIEMDFNKNLVDLYVVKKYLSARILEGVPDVKVPVNTTMESSAGGGLEQFLSKIGDDQRAIDPKEMNTMLHTTLDILLPDEHVVMAFKATRDMTVFTNLRLLEIDVKGWSGKKVEYNSVPYTSIRGFSAESAGGWDRDAEIDIYTRNLWDMAKFEQDFRKGKVDIIVIQKFLSAIVMGCEADIKRYLSSTAPQIEKTDPAGLQHFMAWVTDNSVEEDAQVTDHQLHSDPPILLAEEKVEKVFKKGRDWYVYTTHRFLKVDVQGLMGKKVEYLSIPKKWWRCFEVETAGHLDPDAEVYIHTDVPHKKRMEQDILVKRGDIMDMHEYLTSRVLFGSD